MNPAAVVEGVLAQSGTGFRRGLDQTQGRVSGGGWVTLRVGFPEGVGSHSGSGFRRGLDHTQGRVSGGGWITPRGGLPEGVGCGNGAQLVQRVSQLAAERTLGFSGGAGPPVAGRAGGGAAVRRQAVSLAALTATHCRSLGCGGSAVVRGGCLDAPGPEDG